MIGVCMRFEQIQKIKLLGLDDSQKRIGSCRAGARDSGQIPQNRIDNGGRFGHWVRHDVADCVGVGIEKSLNGWTLERHKRTRSEEHTSELQSLMRISYAVFCL